MNGTADKGEHIRRVAIVGAGQSSLLLGCDLLRHGYDVRVYSARTAEEVLAQPTAAAPFLFGRTLEYERELGLNFWDDEDSWFDALHVDFCLEAGNVLVSLGGQLGDPGQVVDQRRKYSRWMAEFQRRGGELEISTVDVPDLEPIANESDLVMVAAGKGAALADLFPVDEQRSLYTEAPRRLTMLSVRGLNRSPRAIVATLTATDGEIVCGVPFRDEAGDQCCNILFDARPGKSIDRFGELTDPDEVTACARAVLHRFAPSEDESFRAMELTNPRAWMHMEVLPIVRRPVGTLASGRPILAIGDMVVTNDPVAAQGANLASRMAKFFAARIVDRGNDVFDADWMQGQFDEFWEGDARFSYTLSSMFLEMTKPYKDLMLAATQLQPITDEFFDALNDPRALWPWIETVSGVHDHVSEMSKEPWWKVALRARRSVVKHQIGRRLPGRRRRADGLSAP